MKLGKRLSAGRQGFTLIELLVVIAIIGILASLVLVALGNARDKANDARVKANIGQLRTLAEVHYDSGDASYAGFDTCVGGTSADCEGGIEDSVATLVADISEANGGTAPSAEADASNFCISAPLKTDNTTHVCVDSTGVTDETASACDATTHLCP